MYKKFKNCLLHPKLIYQYVDERFSKILLYFLLLAVIYAIPQLVSTIHFHHFPDETLQQVARDFEKSGKIEYQFEKIDGQVQLVSTQDVVRPQYVRLNSYIFSFYPVILLFHEESTALENYQLPTDLEGKDCCYVEFTKDKVSLSIQTYNSNQEDVQKSKRQLFNQTGLNWHLFEMTYEKLGVGTLDLRLAYENKTLFAEACNTFLMGIYHQYKALFLTTGVIRVLIVSILATLFEILILAIIVQFLYRKMNISFANSYKIMILCYTPRVILNTFSILWSSIWLYLLGEIISVIYLLITIRYYSLHQMAKKITIHIHNDNQE
ncbi:MAG: DUF1189 domain-containing protein [Prevotella sp.]|nr:DUF1189 domain-containing protein [Staphylococcus sp.]MCM1350432.1 DUF1189 domain-containing protein [Prevotella sp.]